jgi:hypothetical protein
LVRAGRADHSKETFAMTGHVPETRQTRRLDGVVRDPGLRAAIGYWDSLRGGRALPARMALDPAALRPHLQDAAILEVARPGSVRIRLGGARINALLGMDVRGLPLRALFDLSERAQVSADVEEAIARPAVLILDLMSPAPRFGRPEADALRAQIAIMPMTDSELGATRALYVMGAVSGEASRAEAPHRWCTTQVHSLPLRAGEPVLAAAPPIRADRPVAPPSQGDETETEARGLLARARFRVIEGGLS